MRLLVTLHRRRGEVVSRDELIADCWEGRVVGDDAINACVAKLRRAGEATRAYEIETIPRVGYRLLSDGASPPAPQAGVEDEVLLAVLPFENLSDDPQLSFFSDGVSEEILHTLAQRTGLKVIGRSSSFQFRGPAKAIANVTRQLNVSHVLDGAVRRSGETTRISAQLIDCETQAAVWAGRFDGQQDDIFALQDRVATAVAQAMRCALSPPVRSGVVDPVAYDLYLRGNLPPSNMATAYRAQIALLEEAVERAPGFSDAWASLGFVRAHGAFMLPMAEAPAAREAARAAAAHALALDPQCALAAVAMARSTPVCGEGVMTNGVWLSKALAWAPDSSAATHLHARFLCGVGRNREGLAAMRRAYRLDPLDLHIVAMFGRTLCENGHFAEAVEVLGSVRDRWTEFQLPLLWMIVALALQGRAEAARELFAAHPLGPYEQEVRAFLDNHIQPTPDSGARAIGALRMQGEAGRVDVDTFCAAALLGHLDEAFRIAARAELRPRQDAAAPGGSTCNLSILFTTLMRPIRFDPRFAGLCVSLGLAEYWQATDAWPDCAQETREHYDFKRACREAMEAGPSA